MRGRRTWALPFAICAAYSCGLVWIAVQPSVEVGVSDVDAHAVAYGIHAVLLYWALSVFASPLGAQLGAWLGAGALGATTEVLQSFRPPRSAEVKDLVSDMAGAAVAVVGLVAVRRALGLVRNAAARGRRAGGAGQDRNGAGKRMEDAMVTEAKVKGAEETAADAVCIHCREPIRVSARRCPKCLSWQSRWAADSQNPRLELSLLVAGLAVVAALFTWLYAFGAGRPPAPPPQPSLQMEVVDVTPVPRHDGALAVVGTMRNRSAAAWRDPFLQIRCFSRAGQPVDAFATRAYALFLPAGTDTPFKIVDQTPLHDLSEYASCTVEVRSAQRAD